jgi:hypothetical protein
LEDGVQSDLEIPEGSLRLEFLRQRDYVTVREFIYATEGAGSYSQLVAEWWVFAELAREYLLLEFPGLDQHPYAGGWFRRDPNWN